MRRWMLRLARPSHGSLWRHSTTSHYIAYPLIIGLFTTIELPICIITTPESCIVSLDVIIPPQILPKNYFSWFRTKQKWERNGWLQAKEHLLLAGCHKWESAWVIVAYSFLFYFSAYFSVIYSLQYDRKSSALKFFVPN